MDLGRVRGNPGPVALQTSLFMSSEKPRPHVYQETRGGGGGGRWTRQGPGPRGSCAGQVDGGQVLGLDSWGAPGELRRPGRRRRGPGLTLGHPGERRGLKSALRGPASRRVRPKRRGFGDYRAFRLAAGGAASCGRGRMRVQILGLDSGGQDLGGAAPARAWTTIREERRGAAPAGGRTPA